jgi:hypothetical protein
MKYFLDLLGTPADYYHYQQQQFGQIPPPSQAMYPYYQAIYPYRSYQDLLPLCPHKDCPICKEEARKAEIIRKKEALKKKIKELKYKKRCKEYIKKFRQNGECRG